MIGFCASGQALAGGAVEVVPFLPGDGDLGGPNDVAHPLGIDGADNGLDPGAVAQDPGDGHCCGGDAVGFAQLLELAV